MLVKGLNECDHINYKKLSMFIVFPFCTFKCNKINGCRVCQNENLADIEPLQINIDNLIKRYLNNSLTKAIVCGGMEPFDSPDDLLELVIKFRQVTQDDIVIYTGYTKSQVKDIGNIYSSLKQFNNIIIKFGPFIKDRPSIYDKTLGVRLASDNQYAEVISKHE